MKVEVDGSDVEVVVDEVPDGTRCAGVGLILTHGASGDCKTAQLTQIAQAFSQAGIPTVRFSSRKSVDGRANVMNAVLAKARATMGSNVSHWVLAGRSMGARVAATAAVGADKNIVVGTLLISYPFHPPGKAGDVAKHRSGPILKVPIPSLIVTGSKDPFSTGSLMAECAAHNTLVQLLTIVGADHGLGNKAGKEGLAGAIEQMIAFSLHVGGGGKSSGEEDEEEPNKRRRTKK